MITAPKPPQPIPGGIAGPGLLAPDAGQPVSWITCRFTGSSGSTAATACPSRGRRPMVGRLALAEGVLPPLYRLMIEEVLAVLRGPHGRHAGQGPRRASQAAVHGPFLALRGGRRASAHGLRFTPDRSRDGPAKFLANYRGYLQADAYSAYDGIYSDGKIVEVGCWAHARRNFFEAQVHR